MKFEIDPDVKLVAEFMQRNTPASWLAGVEPNGSHSV
jgi:hypothetical protein